MKNILFFNQKGGVGKTSLATSYALIHELKYVTNDVTANVETFGFTEHLKLDDMKKTLPQEIMDGECVLDMGAMNGNADRKIVDALKSSKAVVIPTLTDANSVALTIESIKEARAYTNSIIVVINRIKKHDIRYSNAFTSIEKHLPESHILYMKETTLYTRLAENGGNLLHYVWNDKGVAQLKKAIDFQRALFSTINTLIENDIKRG